MDDIVILERTSLTPPTARVTAEAECNPFKGFGTRWDGTTGTTGGVN
jgi:hypothetical protein